jgi:hypothetical protein
MDEMKQYCFDRPLKKIMRLVILILLFFSANISIAQNFHYPKPVAYEYSMGKTGMQIDPNVQHFWLCELTDDISFNQIKLTGYDYPAGSNICFTVDIAVYDINGRQLFSMSNLKFQVAQKQGDYFYTIDLTYYWSLKKGKYYFAFYFQNQGCSFPKYPPIYIYSCKDLLSPEIENTPTAFSYYTSKYTRLPAKLPEKEKILKNGQEGEFRRESVSYAVYIFRLVSLK